MEHFETSLKKLPLIEIFRWKNFDRVSPLFWIFLASLVLWIVGSNVNFLSLFAWIGGFLVALFVAVVIAQFENLSF